LAFASENWLTIAVGVYEPGKGWLQAADAFVAPPPGDVYSLFGHTGKLGEVRGIEERHSDPGWIPIEWHARIARGETMRQPFALAIVGSWPDTGPDSQDVPLDDPGALRVVSEYLKKHHLKVESPRLSEAYRMDLGGDRGTALVLAAHSDMSALRDDQEADIYAVALLHKEKPGHEKTISLAHQLSHKASHETISEHEQHYGTRDFYRIIALHDIDGDGRREIVLYRAESDATQIDVYTVKGRHKRHRLSAYKANYN